MHGNNTNPLKLCTFDILIQASCEVIYIPADTKRLCTTVKLIEAGRRIYASVNYPSLIQIIACRLGGAKPLSKSMLEYCWLDPWEQNSVKS